MILNKPFKFKVGDTVLVREATPKDLEDFYNANFRWERYDIGIKEFTIKELKNGYYSGNPYYIGGYKNKKGDLLWFPEQLLNIKEIIKPPKIKIKIGSEELEVSEAIANLISKDNRN